MKKKTKKILCISISVVLGIIAIALIFMGEQLYRYEVANFISNDGEKHGYYVYPDMDADSLYELMCKDYRVASVADWRLHKHFLGYQQPRPGYYEFPARIGNGPLIKALMHGKETPVRVTWTNQIRTRQQLAGRLSSVLMVDSATLIECLDSKEYMQQFGLTPETAVCLFIPNTYEMYWSSSVDDLFARMNREYNRFWTDERQQKADALHMSRAEVATLASIVESETHRQQEHPLIASLYINRLHKGMALQACPTVIFATGNFHLRRVHRSHLQMDSPDNTYRYRGLPPGPIRCANGTAIDAVLNAPKTDYLFMCANPDFSGTHVFSSTYRQHSATAVQYRRALDARNIH